MAESHGLKLLGNAHAHNLCMSEEDGQPRYALEVLLPLAGDPDTSGINS